MEKHLPYSNLLDALKEEGCPICFFLEKAIRKMMDDLLYEKVKVYISTLIEHFKEPKFKSAFRLSFRLCLPHLPLKLCKHKGTIRELIEMEEEKLKSLEQELGEFQRKHDYRFSRER